MAPDTGAIEIFMQKVSRSRTAQERQRSGQENKVCFWELIKLVGDLSHSSNVFEGRVR